MKVIIQCAGSKASNAGSLETRTGMPVKFVARPDDAPPTSDRIYARPDDLSDLAGRSWRDQLVTYNVVADDNPLGLLEAFRLYQDPIYGELVSALSAPNVFILSAGWGLVRATYLLPDYDITFRARSESYQRRRRDDKYNDFCHIHDGESGPVVFLGGKDYLAPFRKLTDHLSFEKIVFFASAYPPQHAEWRVKRFETNRRTNWHYDCARALLKGEIGL